MGRKVLTEAELACLLEVPTTVEQARTILKRNQEILALLKSDRDAIVRIGCPHCLAAGGNSTKLGDCDECKYPFPTDSICEHRCCEYSFGGIQFDALGSIIDLRADRAIVDLAYGDPLVVENAITWTKGHIEWAREVIRRGTRRGKAKR